MEKEPVNNIRNNNYIKQAGKKKGIKKEQL